ncbi:hypothetical protein BH09MYX1_BH09MYX1_35710 [soil metagenome]
MNQEHLDAIFKTLELKPAGADGWRAAPEGMLLTFQLAHAGAAMSVSRVESVRVDGPLVWTRSAKKEINVFSRDDVFALATDGGAAQPARRPGFA